MHLRLLLLYLWFVSQSTQTETPEEYRRNKNALKLFLHRQETKKAISVQCRKAVLDLQLNLNEKKSKLAGYQRMDRRNCMEAMTTSPAESNNNFIKHFSSQVSSKTNIDNSTIQILAGILKRLIDRLADAERELGTRNKASRSPTAK